MISKEEYDAIQLEHKEGCKTNDYSKMMMIGSDKWKKCREYEQEFVCKHPLTKDEQGGQIIECISCGKQWQ